MYENDTPSNGAGRSGQRAESRAAFLAVWPIGKFPVLQDEARAQLVPESSIIIEYLAQHYPGPSELVPSDPDQAREARLLDCFADLHVMPMQKVVGDRIRPSDQRDPFGVEQAKAALRAGVTACASKR